MKAFRRALLALGLAGVIAAKEGSGIVVAAVIAGCFMLVNSLLTIWLTNRITRRRNGEGRRHRRR